MIIPRFTIDENGKAITCRQCGRASHHPQDIRERYCGQCHVFHLDATKAELRKFRAHPDALVKARTHGMTRWAKGRVPLASECGKSIVFECDEGLPLTACGIHSETLKQTVPLLFNETSQGYVFLFTGVPYDLETTI